MKTCEFAAGQRLLVVLTLLFGCTGSSAPPPPSGDPEGEPPRSKRAEPIAAAPEPAAAREADALPLAPASPANAPLRSDDQGAASPPGSPLPDEEPPAPSEPPLATGPGSDDAAPEEEPPAPVEIDRQRGEVRFPCRFINPSRQIEVFACHKRGPSHETVLEFDPTGEQLYRALLEIGCRPIDHWNVTSPSDFLRNQGDRVLVLVRWTWEGKERELPAEALLANGDSDFPSFVRGFSFSAFDVDAARQRAEAARKARVAPTTSGPAKGSARDDGGGGGGDAGPKTLSTRKDDAAPAGDDGVDGARPEEDDEPIVPGVPVVVELSLGAVQRQRAAFALLSHPTTLSGAPGAPGAPLTRNLQTWSAEPLVDSRVIPDLRRVVAEQPPAQLIFRRMRSEIALLQYTRAVAVVRGESRREPLFERLEPIAREIDRLKAFYEKDARQIRGILRQNLEDYFGDSGRELEIRAEMLRRRGQWLCSRIQELYFTMYLLQEEFKLREIEREKRPEQAIAAAKFRVESGLRFEVKIAEKERQRDENSLGTLIISEEIWGLELERQERAVDVELSRVVQRLAELGDDEEYLRELLLPDQKRWTIARRAIGFRRTLNRILRSEARSFLDGTLTSREAGLAARRRTALQGLRTARIEDDVVRAEDDLRWFRNDLESRVPDRQRDAREKIAETTSRLEELRTKLDAAREELRNVEDEEKSAGERSVGESGRDE